MTIMVLAIKTDKGRKNAKDMSKYWYVLSRYNLSSM